MNRDEALQREREGLPIETFRELVHALRLLQARRTADGTPVWYALNRFQREAIEFADREEKR